MPAVAAVPVVDENNTQTGQAIYPIIQEFDPAGVGARDLGDRLAIRDKRKARLNKLKGLFSPGHKQASKQTE